MNTIPRNYLSKLNIRETQEAQFFLLKELIEAIEENFDVIQVREPKISTFRISATGLLKHGDRMINFDASNDNKIYTLYSEYKHWLVNVVKNLDIKNNHGIFSITNNIKRDNEISNTQSLEENLLQIEYRYDNAEKSFEKSKELLETTVNVIKVVEKKLIEKYPKLSKSFPSKIVVKEFRKTQNWKSIDAMIIDMVMEQKVFAMINRKKIQFSNNFETSLMAYSPETGKHYSPLTIHGRKTLQDIEPQISESESIMEEYIFRKDILKEEEEIRTINISINLDLLSLMILNKSHILELQSGKNVKEIEKILSMSGIKHI